MGAAAARAARGGPACGPRRAVTLPSAAPSRRISSPGAQREHLLEREDACRRPRCAASRRRAEALAHGGGRARVACSARPPRRWREGGRRGLDRRVGDQQRHDVGRPGCSRASIVSASVGSAPAAIWTVSARARHVGQLERHLGLVEPQAARAPRRACASAAGRGSGRCRRARARLTTSSASPPSSPSSAVHSRGSWPREEHAPLVRGGLHGAVDRVVGDELEGVGPRELLDVDDLELDRQAVLGHDPLGDGLAEGVQQRAAAAAPGRWRTSSGG